MGSFESGRPLELKDDKSKLASFIAPKVQKPETIHIILAVTDNGTPALTRYKRVVVSVMP